MLPIARAASTTTMFNFSTLVQNPQSNTLFFSPFPFSPSSPTPRKFHSLKLPTNSNLHNSLSSSFQNDNDEEHVIGDCLVFEEGIFEDPIFPTSSDNLVDNKKPKPTSKKKKKVTIKSENLVPDKWREVQAELNITKKEGRKIAQEIEFNSKVLKKKIGLVPLRDMNLEDYRAYKEAMLAKLKPMVLDKPPSFSFAEKEEEEEEELEDELNDGFREERVEPKNPRWAVYGRGLEDVNEFLNSPSYELAVQKTEGRPKLFTKEEKALLSMNKPDLSVATSDKWLPLHTFAASAESFLLETLLKHGVDINAMDKDGLTALNKSIIGRKHAITNHLLRNSANPFVQDNDGASLMHYAVQTASVPTIKVLLLYNVDINLQDNDGWTPLHLAVQTQRNDVVKLLLIKGADKTLKNKDGLTPLDLCLYSGQSIRTYELIKLLKQPPRRFRNTRKKEYVS
ncbi:ankyrin repeat domain-containing protein, chloroplastic [Vicia villosa]|uniref:ankyrin repeat domain-containing protein, chloroplastic n=1 Tax=Vicia villosa TaxID=3911 RepID=UPI00273C956D|nr:ankyrin repeat domain-containing protein, chloroplastic [Vicia villosa]